MVKHLQEEPSETKGLRYLPSDRLIYCTDTDRHVYRDAGDDPETVRREIEFAEKLNKQEDIYVEK